MKRMTLFAVATIALVLPVVYGKATQTERRSEPPKGKVLVRQLPAGAEGMELKDGVVRLQAGYKFVKRAGNKIGVEKMAGGGAPQAGGSWICDCSGGGGGCTTLTDGTYLFCNKAKENGCKESCVLTITTDGVRKGVILY